MVFLYVFFCLIIRRYIASSSSRTQQAMETLSEEGAMETLSEEGAMETLSEEIISKDESEIPAHPPTPTRNPRNEAKIEPSSKFFNTEKKTPGAAPTVMLMPPLNFSMVVPGVYRCRDIRSARIIPF